MSDYQPVPIEELAFERLPRVWGDEVIWAKTEKYLGKVLYYKSGTAGGLQAHHDKDESFYLFEGLAWVDSDDGSGKLTRTLMTPGDAFRIPPGAAHRFEAIIDCVVFEVSTAHFNDRRRLEEHYNVPVIGDEEGLPSTW